MKIVRKHLSELHEPKMNVRRHTEKQITEYIRSLKMFGQVKPVLVDEYGEIIAGNGLYEALIRMGETECECYVISGLSENQKKKLMLADNRVYELGITDTDMLDEIVKSLDGDIDVPGWDADLLEMLNASLEETTEMVESYGTFEQDEVDKVNARSATHIPVAGAPISGAEGANPQGGYSSTPESAAALSESGSEADMHRYIICPKCGERICL